MTQVQSRSLFDQPDGYGRVSRALHWLMALLFAWQFMTAIFHWVDRKAAATQSVWDTHHDVGFLLFLLVVVRAIWGFVNLARRPRHAGLVGSLATLGHVALYALMIYVPAIALLRLYGAGHPFAPFGIPLLEGNREKIEWMVKLGSATHSVAAWLLLALVAGHVLMVLVHQFVWRDDTTRRMVRGAV